MTTKSTKDTKNYENCILRGNRSRGYVLESRVEFNLKEKLGDCGWVRRAMPFVTFVRFVVDSF